MTPTAQSVERSSWAGVPLVDRRSERRERLIAAAYELFGEEGEAGLAVRAVCRACGFNTRYFYESFRDTDELLGAVYDQLAMELGLRVLTIVGQAGDRQEARVRAGIREVLEFSAADPRRGRLLFTDARSNRVLTARRALAQQALLEEALFEDSLERPDVDPLARRVQAAMFTGAMVGLVEQWLAGALGDDLDGVVDTAVERALA